MNLNKNYYKILKIEKSATAEQIKKAYFKLAKKYHPDVNDLEESVILFREIKEAYHVLTNFKKDYDKNSPHFKKKATLDIELEVVPTYVKQVVKYKILQNCKKCDGTGFDVTLDYSKCKRCQGEGEDDNGVECKKCLGTGKAYDSVCKTCKGKKQNVIDTSVSVKFDKDVKQLILPYHGNQSLKTNHNGNLILNAVAS